MKTILGAIKDTVIDHERFSPDIRIKSLFTVTTFTAITLIVIGPVLFLLLSSVYSRTDSRFTLRGYEDLLSSQVFDTLANTFIVAAGGTFVALVVGIAAVIYAQKTDGRGGHLISILIIGQYLLPSYLTAVAWEFYAGPNGILNKLLMLLPFVDSAPINIFSLLGIIIVGGTHYAGIVYLLISGAIGAITASLEESGMVAGAPIHDIIRKVTLPIAFPALSMAAIIVFVRLLQSFGIPLVLGLPADVYVFATHMYIAIQSFPPDFVFASALGVPVLLFTVGLLALHHRSVGDREVYEVVTGEERRTLIFSLKGKQRLFSVAFVGSIFFLYIIPYLILIVSSFQQTIAGLTFDVSQWTTDNYEALFVGGLSDAFWNAMSDTLFIAGVGAFITMILATAASYVIVKSDSRTSRVLDFLTLSPIAIPPIIIGVSYLWIFGFTNDIVRLYGTTWGIILALTGFVAYGSRATNSSFRAIHSQLEEAAEISGAGILATIKRIYIPLVKSGFISGYVLLFIDFAKVVTVPILLAGGDTEVISVFLIRMINGANSGEAAATGTIMLLLIGFVYVAVSEFTDVEVTKL